MTTKPDPSLEQTLPEPLIDQVVIQNDMDFTCMEETAAAMPEDLRPELIIGNTAEEVLNQVDCSVLTVKPEGFVSPVRPRD